MLRSEGTLLQSYICKVHKGSCMMRLCQLVRIGLAYKAEHVHALCPAVTGCVAQIWFLLSCWDVVPDSQCLYCFKENIRFASGFSMYRNRSCSEQQSERPKELVSHHLDRTALGDTYQWWHSKQAGCWIWIAKKRIWFKLFICVNATENIDACNQPLCLFCLIFIYTWYVYLNLNINSWQLGCQ